MPNNDTFEGPGLSLDALARRIAALVSSPTPRAPLPRLPFLRLPPLRLPLVRGAAVRRLEIV